MSLEAAIEKNTEALTALLAHLQAGGVPVAPPAAKGASKKPPAPPVEGASTGAASDSVAGATQQADTVVAGPTYDQVKEAVMKLSAKKGRDAAVAVLKAQGVAKVPDLKPEQYAAVLVDVDARLAA